MISERQVSLCSLPSFFDINLREGRMRLLTFSIILSAGTGGDGGDAFTMMI
jgi:hypothetical protein